MIEIVAHALNLLIISINTYAIIQSLILLSHERESESDCSFDTLDHATIINRD